jgi:hypothetical protein
LTRQLPLFVEKDGYFDFSNSPWILNRLLEVVGKSGTTFFCECKKNYGAEGKFPSAPLPFQQADLYISWITGRIIGLRLVRL